MSTPDLLSHVTIDLSDDTIGENASHLRDGWTGCLLHGFGASAQDLVGLAPAISGAPKWKFPHAPVAITVAGMSYGRAWFPREKEALEGAIYGSYFQNLRNLEPPGLAESAEDVRRLLTTTGVSWDSLILGGFSQGAMVAAEILRRGISEPGFPLPAGVLLFSGSLIAESWWDSLETDAGARERARQVPVFQCHGRRDGVLPYSEGWALAERLRSAGFPLNFLAFDEGHTIPAEAHQKAATFVQSVIRATVTEADTMRFP